MGTCWPQPHQEVFSGRGVSLVIQGREEEEGWGLARQVAQVPRLHILVVGGS